MRLAVYGTLREGGTLNGNMKAVGAKFIEKTTLKGYKMYDTGWFPAVFKTNDDKDEIVIESYEIPEESLTGTFDRVEGYPHLYNREETPKGWIYFMEDQKRIKDYAPIKSGDWFNKNK